GRGSVKAVTLHADFGIHHHLPFQENRFSYCTMIRHPVMMLGSLYNYSLQHPEAHYHGLAKQSGSLRAWFLSPDRPWDTLTYVLTGYGNRSRGASGALDNLLTQIDFFGITELYEQSVAAFCRHYGFPAAAPSHLNSAGEPDDVISYEE